MEECKHNWKEEYYGTRCDICNLFYPFGCAPWDDDEEPDDDRDDYDDDLPDEFEEAMQNCGMLADGTCMKAGSEECDWECPFSEELG